MQSGIALSAFVLLKLCDKLLYRSVMLLCYATFPLWWWGSVGPAALTSIERKVSTLQDRLRSYAPIVKSATVEFHKAQCFFMLSIEIAAQVVVKQGSLNEGTTKLQGLFNNYSLIGSISISGLLPVTFTLLSLHTVGMGSLYLLILSTITVAMSAATLIGIGDFNVSRPDIQRVTSHTTDRYPKCGNNDPTTYCLDLPGSSTVLTSMRLEKGAVGGSSLLLSLIILAFLMLKRLQQTYMPIERLLARRSKDLDLAIRTFTARTNSRLLRWSVKYRQNLLHALVECLCAAIWVLYLVLFAYYLSGLTYPSNGAKTTPVNTWTFGQIVAITVWAVPIFEFVKLSVGECCISTHVMSELTYFRSEGIEKGLNYRTPLPYRITKISEAAETPNSIETYDEDSLTRFKQKNEIV